MARQQLSSPFESFVAGRSARQAHDLGATRNKLAEMELENAPAEMQRRNALADLQLQGAQQDVAQGQYQIDAIKAKDGYTRLRQALDSGSPREYVLRHEPELVAKLQEQGFDLSIADEAYTKQVLDGFARHYAGKAGIAPTPKMETLQTESGGVLQRDPTTGALKQVVAPQKPDHFAQTQAAADRRAADARAHAEQMAEEQRRFTADQNDLNRKAASDLKSETALVKERVIAKQNEKAYNTYQAGMAGLVKGLGGTNTGPIAGRMPAVTAKQQIADGAVAAMAPVLKGLFRSAGEGTFTDKDQEMLLAMMPTRLDEPEARAAKLANVDAIVRAKLGLSTGVENQNQRPPLSSFQK